VEVDRRDVQADLGGGEIQLEEGGLVGEDDGNGIAPFQTEGTQAVRDLVRRRQ
jgi:hypothetical protein